MTQTEADSAGPSAGTTSRGLLRSTSVVGLMTLISRISGLTRDIVLANAFGASGRMDIFLFALRMPNLLRRFFAEGAFAQAFVPVITEYRDNRGLTEARALIARVSGTLALVLFAITLLGVIAAPILVFVFGTAIAVGDGPVDLATTMLRLTFPYIFFMSLTAMAGAVLNSWGRFAVPAFTPVLLNLSLIGASIWLAPRFDEPVVALAAGVFIAGAVQLAFQIPFLLHARLLPAPRIDFAHEGVRRIAKLMGPVLFGSSIAQISILLNTWIALFLVDGSVTWLHYSDRLIEFPLGVFGIALATVILPTLSSQHVSASREAFDATIDWALRSVLLVGIPAAVAVFLLADAMLTTMFFGGEFTGLDVAMSAASLRAMAPGLLGFMLVKVLVSGFYSRQDTRTPVGIAVRALLVGMASSAVFVLLLLRIDWLPPHAGLAAATALSSLVNAGLLYRALRRAGAYRPRPGWGKLFLRVALAVLGMAVFLVYLLNLAGDWRELSLVLRISWLAAAVLGGATVYFVCGYLAGLRPAQFRASQ